MCLICNDKRLTAIEGIKNLFEMKSTISEEHFGEVYIALLEKLCQEDNIKTGLDLLEKLLNIDFDNICKSYLNESEETNKIKLESFKTIKYKFPIDSFRTILSMDRQIDFFIQNFDKNEEKPDHSDIPNGLPWIEIKLSNFINIE